MEHFTLYILKAGGLIALFFIAYHLLLKKETFFMANRWFLLSGLITSVVLPLVVYTKIIWVAPQPQRAVSFQSLNLAPLNIINNPPVAETFKINWWYTGMTIYAIGVLFFLTRLAIDFYKIRRIFKNNHSIKLNGYKFIDSATIQSPFSFFRTIVYNAALLQPEELEGVIAHEKVHSSQKHSADMIISQLFCAAFWFNPFIWLYKKAISQNLEFIADAKAINTIKDKKIYQKTLLKITLQPDCIAVTNHFYQSLIKKRIVMLNKQQSKRRNSCKYAVILPVLVAFMLIFQIKVIAQEKEQIQGIGTKTSFSESIDINKDATDTDLKVVTASLKKTFNADVKISNIKRNKNMEITALKVAAKYNGQSKTYEVNGDKPITAFKIEVADNDDGVSELNFITTAKQAFLNQSVSEAKKDSTNVTKSTQDKTSINGKAIIKKDDEDAQGEHWAINSMKIADKDVLIVINGIKQKMGKVIEIPLGQELDELKILKNDEAKKYGKEGKNGVVLITTKKKGVGLTKESRQYWLKYKTTAMNADKIQPLFASKTPDMATPISQLASPDNNGTTYIVTRSTRISPDENATFTTGVKYTENEYLTLRNDEMMRGITTTNFKSGNTIVINNSAKSVEELEEAINNEKNTIEGIDRMLIQAKKEKIESKILALKGLKKSHEENIKALEKAKKERRKADKK